MAKKKRFVMKIIILIILFCFTNVFSQNKSIDTMSISFKAKLFTISEYGIANKKQILNDIENEEIMYLKTKYKNFLFIKILFSQPYRLPNNHEQTLYRDCYYYMAFNLSDSKYYRLGGFNSLDIDDFFKDLKLRERIIFKDIAEGNEIEGIDIYCLYKYYKMKKLKRAKKGFSCLENCSKNTKTEVIVK